MGKNNLFNTLKAKHLKLLDQYIPIVAKVHGEHHPEFYEVQKLFNSITKKIKESGKGFLDLHEEFTKLQQITDNYHIPGDVCESYEAVYKMLEELDGAYGFLM